MKETLSVPTGLWCNYLTNPLGVESQKPLLGWQITAKQEGWQQSAYQILVASSLELLERDEGDLWDSGKVRSSQSVHISYQGRPLASREMCYWKVRVWDQEDSPGPWSQHAWWEMGLLSELDWHARWICAQRKPVNDEGLEALHSYSQFPGGFPAPMFRKSFTVDKKPIKARAYISGLGYYELQLNGEKVGDTVLDPAVSVYDKTVHYQTYDLTDQLQMGENAVGVLLGDGWYNCFTAEVWNFAQAPWRDDVKLLLQIHLDFEDGTQQVIATDPTWRVAMSPITFNGLRNGEYYDARLEQPGWSSPGFDDSNWQQALLARAPGGVLKSQQMVPIRRTGSIEPVSCQEVKPGVWVYDLGQNISGWAKIRLQGEAGTTVTLKYAEKLKADGDIDPSNIDIFVKKGEFQTDRYTLKGEGTEIWEPSFTYHGFRYVQVTGFPGTLTLDNLTGEVVHTDFATRGEFSCSNELFNTIQRCARWSTLTNYHGIPTDCPHREKNGWTGDAQLSAEQTLLNFNPMTAYTKWLADFIDVQRPSGQLPGFVPTGGWGFNWGSGPAWDSALILIPWYQYVYCGDLNILRQMYPSMIKYMAFLTSMAIDGIVDFGLGDWCPPEGNENLKTPVALTSTAYYYVDTVLLSKIASLLGDCERAEAYKKQAVQIRAAFRARFIDNDAKAVGPNTQTALACALYQGLALPEETGWILERLVAEIEKCSWHLDFGILGAKYVLHSLTEYDRADVAYAIASQETYPSWGYWIQQGATTLWEDWQGESSRNHHMFSDISAWFYKGLAGINPDPEEPGFKHIIIRPNPVGDLKWVRCWHESLYGKIVCNWERTDDQFTLKLEIPANNRATVLLPAEKPEQVAESGVPIAKSSRVEIAGQQGRRLCLKILSGSYDFRIGNFDW